MARKNIRLPPVLDDKVEKELDKLGGKVSFSDYVRDAVEHYLVCSKLEHDAPMRLIVLQYPATCLKNHEHKIEAGQWALYGRGVGAICLDCYVERLGDKAVVSKYLKMRELKQIIKALTLEADRLAQTVEEYQVIEKIKELHDLATEMHKKLMQYLQSSLGTADETKTFDELTELQRRLTALVQEHEALIEKRLSRKRWTKRAKAGAQ